MNELVVLTVFFERTVAAMHLGFSFHSMGVDCQRCRNASDRIFTTLVPQLSPCTVLERLDIFIA